MPIYDGVVTLDDNRIPVLIELNGERMRMSASGTEIGSWPLEECRIAHLEESTYAITAEDETLLFVPNQPSLFAAEVNVGRPPAVPLPPPVDEEIEVSQAVKTAPPPRPLTVGLFYALCLVTGALGIWALINMVF